MSEFVQRVFTLANQVEYLMNTIDILTERLEDIEKVVDENYHDITQLSETVRELNERLYYLESED